MPVSTEPTEQGQSIDQPLEPATEMTLAERIESVKAGGIGAIATGLTFAALGLLNQWLERNQITLLTGTGGIHLLVSLLSAVFAGFLFGITYRYVVRRDRNPHLGDGAVLAFGLVRGFAQAEVALPHQSQWLPLVVTGAESVALFAIARILLDAAIDRGWVKAFR